MSFADCIRRHAAQGIVGKNKTGTIPQATAEALISEYESLVQKYSVSLGDEAAAHAAAEYYVGIKSAIINKKIENDFTHALVQKRLAGYLQGKADNIKADKDQAKYGKWLFGNPYARATREFLQEVFVRHQSLERQAHAMIADVIEKFRSKNAGFSQEVAGFKDVVREMGGVKTGSKMASEYGAAIRETFDTLHTMFEDAGGILGKLENYFPQIHTPELVGRSSFSDWRSFIRPLLDREKMINPETAMPFNDGELDGALKAAYDSIRTNGLIDIAKKADAGGQKLGVGGDVNMRQSSARFFHFKDVDAFLEYNTKYGVQDAGLFGAVMHHISAMTRDISIMQKMGPKPGAIMRNLDLKLQAEKAGPATHAAINGMYNTLAGKNSYNGELPGWYKALSGWINLKRAAYLGTAPVSALSDSFFIGYAAKMNGLEATGALKQYYSLLNPLNEADRRIARRHVFVASAASGMSLQGARFSDDIGHGGMTGFLAGVTNRASGLAAMTDAGKHAMGLELAGALAEHQIAKTAFKDIDPAFRKAAEAYGIDAKDWDVMLKSTPEYMDEVDSHFMFPENIAGLGQEGIETAQKFSDWTTGLALLALNEPTLLTRAITTGAAMGDARPGTAIRALMSNVFFAKSFPITVMINHLVPALRDAALGRGGHLAAITIGSAVFGAVAVQARQIVSGKDPRDMTMPSFWTAALLQGGGLGMFGDFMFADYNRFGNSMGATLAGPVVGSMESILKIGDLDNFGDEKKFNKMLRDTWRLVNREIPVVRLWYTRLIVERLLLDQVEKMIDPSYTSRMRKIENRMKKQTGQGFWWTPGNTAPERSPDLTAVAGGHK